MAALVFWQEKPHARSAAGKDSIMPINKGNRFILLTILGILLLACVCWSWWYWRLRSLGKDAPLVGGYPSLKGEREGPLSVAEGVSRFGDKSQKKRAFVTMLPEVSSGAPSTGHCPCPPLSRRSAALRLLSFAAFLAILFSP